MFFADARNQLRQLSKMPQLLAPTRGVGPACGGQNIYVRLVEQFFLHAKFAFPLGKLFVSQLPVKGHDVGRELLELLREDDTAFGVVFALQLFDAFRGTLHQVGKSNAEFDHPLVVVVIEGLRHNPAFVEHGPEFVSAAGIVMANADGGLARIAADDHELHAFAEMVGKCSHYASLLCLLILLPTVQTGSALFDIGSRAITGVLDHGFLTPTILKSCMKHGNAVTFPCFLNLISSKSIQTRGRRKCSMLKKCAPRL